MATKQYSKPQVIELDDAIKATMGLPWGRFRDIFGRRAIALIQF